MSESVERRDGTECLAKAIDLVLAVLRDHPTGLTNSEVGEATGLNPDISVQHGYVTWSLLRYLVEQGRVVKDGRIYRLRRP